MTTLELVKEHTESLTEPTDEALERLINDNLHLLGHGTTLKENAESILKTGLKSPYPDLYRAADQLFTLADDPNALAKNKEAITDWGHLDSKYIVLLGVERLEEGQAPNNRYLQSIMQPNSEGDKEYDKAGIVDHRFVAGYFDTTNDTFVHNPDFDPHYDPDLYKTTADEQIRRTLDKDPNANPVDALIGDSAVKSAGIIDPSTWGDGPDIW